MAQKTSLRHIKLFLRRKSEFAPIKVAQKIYKERYKVGCLRAGLYGDLGCLRGDYLIKNN